METRSPCLSRACASWLCPIRPKQRGSRLYPGNGRRELTMSGSVPKSEGYQKQPEQSGWDEARDQPVLEVVDWWYGLHERMCHELQLRGHMDPRKGASPAAPDALQCSSFDRERVWGALLHTTAALCAIPRPDGRACPAKKAGEGAPSSISWRRYRSMHILHRSSWTPVPGYALSAGHKLGYGSAESDLRHLLFSNFAPP
jgi:hypothetical protein